MIVGRHGEDDSLTLTAAELLPDGGGGVLDLPFVFFVLWPGPRREANAISFLSLNCFFLAL